MNAKPDLVAALCGDFAGGDMPYRVTDPKSGTPPSAAVGMSDTRLVCVLQSKEALMLVLGNRGAAMNFPFSKNRIPNYRAAFGDRRTFF